MAFSPARPDRPIALVGPMGSGKSTVGRLLAQRLGLPFHDSDDAITDAAGLSIAALFDRDGEAAFRVLERKTLALLLEHGRGVIATGGGAPADADTRRLLNARAFTIWLDADPTVLARRLEGAVDRPLLRGGDRLALLADLAERRRGFYGEADLHVATDGLAPEGVVETILAALQPHSGCRWTG